MDLVVAPWSLLCNATHRFEAHLHSVRALSRVSNKNVCAYLIPVAEKEAHARAGCRGVGLCRAAQVLCAEARSVRLDAQGAGEGFAADHAPQYGQVPQGAWLLWWVFRKSCKANIACLQRWGLPCLRHSRENLRGAHRTQSACLEPSLPDRPIVTRLPPPHLNRRAGGMCSRTLFRWRARWASRTFSC